MRQMLSLTVLSLIAALGCITEKEKKVIPKQRAPEKKAPPAPPPENPVSVPECITPWSTTGAAKTVKVGTKTLEVTGTKLVDKNPDEDKKAVLGVMANLKEDTAANLENIATFVKIFQTQKVDAIVIAGDLGETQAQIENVIAPIAASGIPAFAVIGNREKRTDFNAALAKFADKGVFNMGQIRLADLDDVALVSLPGYYDVGFIHAVQGCQYFPQDLKNTETVIKAAGNKPVVLVSHGGPKQAGKEALDYTLDEANVGDPQMTQLIKDAGLKFGIFANIHESGGRGTDLAGGVVVKPKTSADTLFLNPGAVDAVSWQMNEGGRSVGMAATMTIVDGKASYEVHRIKEK